VGTIIFRRGEGGVGEISPFLDREGGVVGAPRNWGRRRKEEKKEVLFLSSRKEGGRKEGRESITPSKKRGGALGMGIGRKREGESRTQS